MDKRISQRKSGQVIAAAIASVGLAGWGASQADASLVMDVRATGATAGNTISADGKTVSYTSGTVTVTMGVFARLSGTNATQQIGEFGGLGGDDTRNDDQMNLVTGSFNSVGGLLGTLGGTAVAGANPNYGTRTVPFTGGGSTNGIVQDWDSDGDLDIGNGATTDPTTLWVARAAGPSQSTIFNGSTAVTKGWSQGPDGSAQAGANANDSVIDPTTQEIQVGSIRFITTGQLGAGAATARVNLVQRPGTDGGVALWFEDGVATNKTPGTSPFTVNPTGVLVVAPEPASLGLLGIASLGLLARRRKQD